MLSISTLPITRKKTKEEGNDYKEEVEASKLIYRDKFSRDGWLNLMNERLKLAKRLLSNSGVIFISIDDNECAYLKVLCDEIFVEDNFISECFVLDNLKGKKGDKFITSVGHKILIYAKDKLNIKGFNQVKNPLRKFEEKYDQEDENGPYNEVTFKKTGQDKFRECRSGMFYPILVKNGRLFSIKDDEYDKIYDKHSKTFNDNFLSSLKNKYEEEGYYFVLPLDSNNKYLRWTSGFDTYKEEIKNDNLIYKNSGVYQKKRPEFNEILEHCVLGTPKNFWYDSGFSMGTTDLKVIMNKENAFSFPKPVSLIKYLLKLYTCPVEKKIIILDFFAGSGTTGQAVMELNEEDGGCRQFILVTNNENEIAETITRERLYRVITGTGSKGEKFKWIYKKDTPYLRNNSVRIFNIEYTELFLKDLDKAERLKETAKVEFKKLNESASFDNDFDIYNELAALNPNKKGED